MCIKTRSVHCNYLIKKQLKVALMVVRDLIQGEIIRYDLALQGLHFIRVPLSK